MYQRLGPAYVEGAVLQNLPTPYYLNFTVDVRFSLAPYGDVAHAEAYEVVSVSLTLPVEP